MESLFPSIPLGFLLSILTILMLWGTKQRASISGVYLLMLLAVFYRSFIFSWPASLIGLDPDKFASHIYEVSQTGGTEALSVYFYSDASAFIVSGSIYNVISGIGAPGAMVIFPFMIGALFPTGVAVISRYMNLDSQTIMYAVAIASVGLISIWLAYWPIAQTLGAVLLVVWFISISGYENSGEKKYIVIMCIVLAALMFTHKMPLSVIVLSTGVFLLASSIYNTVDNKKLWVDQRWLIIGSLTIITLMLQWGFLTNYIYPVGMKISELIFSTTPVSDFQGVSTRNPSRAIAAYSGIFGIFARRIHAFVLLPLSGIGWAYLMVSRSSDRVTWIVLAASSVSVLFISFGVVNPSTVTPLRAVFLSEPFLAILIAILITRIKDISQDHWLRAGNILLILVLVSQLSAVYVTPDHPAHARTYLTTQEIQGKQFGHTYVNSPIYTDAYFASERPPYQIINGAYTNSHYLAFEGELLNGKFIDKKFNYISYRTEVDIYRLPGGIWRLSWNPETHLDYSYSRIYSNGGVNTYTQYRTDSIS